MSDTWMVAGSGSAELSQVVTQLLKGALYRDTNERQWVQLLVLRSQVADFVSVLGLVAVVDEAEGYAYLRSPEVTDEALAVPRLIARRTLPFHVSVLLALLRKKLAEFDASSADPRLVLSREQIIEMLRLFIPESSNEVRLIDNIDAHINRVVELGFLRRLRGETNVFEVRRIIKAFVDGQWLADFDERLREYASELGGRASDHE